LLRERAGAKAQRNGDGRENSNVFGHFPLIGIAACAAGQQTADFAEA
jgi:hypothetical protein